MDSINNYQGLQVLVGDSPDELVSMIKSIRLPITIVQITTLGAKQVCYFICTTPVKKVSKKSNEQKIIIEKD